MTLRELWNTTQHSHTDIVLCDENAKEFVYMKTSMADDCLAETEVIGITAVDETIRVYVDQNPMTIKHWRTKYSCMKSYHVKKLV